MPAESKHEQIAEYVKTAVASISVASGAWYTIQAVARVNEPLVVHWNEARERPLGGRPLDVFALVFPGEDESIFDRSTESATKDMLLGIVVSRWSELDRKTAVAEPTGAELIFPENPGDALPSMWTVQNRLMKDLKDRLALDLTFGGLVTELLFEHENRQYIVNGWDCIHLPLLIRYHHPRRAS